MEGIQNQIKISKVRWFKHAARMNEHRIPKRLLEVKKRKKVQGQFKRAV
jgi:hypothetical protein